MSRLPLVFFLSLLACSDPVSMPGQDAMPGPTVDARSSPDAAFIDMSLAPSCKPPVDVSAPFLVAAGGSRASLAVASDGEKFLVTWGLGNDLATPLFGTWIATDGKVLGPPFLISPDAGGVELAFGGDNFLVVWHNASGNGLRGTWVGRKGSILDTPPLVISDAKWLFGHHVAFDGRDFLVVWEQDFPDGNVYGARVSRQGTVLDPHGFPIAANGEEHSPGIACSGTSCLVVWQHNAGGYSEIQGARIDQSGTDLSMRPIVIAAGPGPVDPAVGHSGSGYLVAWDDSDRVPMFDRNFAARVDDAGKVLDPHGFAVVPRGNEGIDTIVSDGAAFFVLLEEWHVDGFWALYGGRVTREGVSLDPDGISIDVRPAGSSGAHAAYGAGRYLVVWLHEPEGKKGWEIYGAIISAPSRCKGQM